MLLRNVPPVRGAESDRVSEPVPREPNALSARKRSSRAFCSTQRWLAAPPQPESRFRCPSPHGDGLGRDPDSLSAPRNEVALNRISLRSRSKLRGAACVAPPSVAWCVLGDRLHSGLRVRVGRPGAPRSDSANTSAGSEISERAGACAPGSCCSHSRKVLATNAAATRKRGKNQRSPSLQDESSILHLLNYRPHHPLEDGFPVSQERTIVGSHR